MAGKEFEAAQPGDLDKVKAVLIDARDPKDLACTLLLEEANGKTAFKSATKEQCDQVVKAGVLGGPTLQSLDMTPVWAVPVKPNKS